VLLGEPPRTQADLHFGLFGFRVRVSPFFWLVSLLLGWNFAQTKDGLDARLLLVWVAVVFVSILLHELGHAVAFRYFGIPSFIVLYHFGGMAIPESAYTSYSGFGHDRSQRPGSKAIIAVAGPGIQLAVVAVIVAGLFLARRQMYFSVPFVPQTLTLGIGEPISYENEFLLLCTLWSLLYVNLFWALVNLLPVYPLDGGQIARDLFLMWNVRDAVRNSLILSIVTGAAIAVLAVMERHTFLALMFGMLAFSSFQTLQMHSGRGGGFGGGRPW
jgi:Zn-dependent protease